MPSQQAEIPLLVELTKQIAPELTRPIVPELTRQTVPLTNIGHAPPTIESRTSSQSVKNDLRVDFLTDLVGTRFVWLVMLNHPLGPSITKQINRTPRDIYFPKCSIYTSLQKYASIPFITQYISNKPEVNTYYKSYYKRGADRPNNNISTKYTAEAKVPQRWL